MIGRYRHFHTEVSECEGKFAPTCKLMVLPSLKIGIHAQSWIPLTQGENMVAVLRKELISTTSTVFHAVDDVVIPFHFENEFHSRHQIAGHIHPHHGLVDGVFQRFARRIGYRNNLVTVGSQVFRIFKTGQISVVHGTPHLTAVKPVIV